MVRLANAYMCLNNEIRQNALRRAASTRVATVENNANIEQQHQRRHRRRPRQRRRCRRRRRYRWRLWQQHTFILVTSYSIQHCKLYKMHLNEHERVSAHENAPLRSFLLSCILLDGWMLLSACLARPIQLPMCVCMYVCFEFDRSCNMQKIIMWLARATNILISFLLYSHTHCPDLYSLWYLAVWCSIILILSLQFKHTHTYIRTQNVPFFFVDFLLNRYSVLIHSPKHNIIDRNYFTVSNENENCFPKK